MSSTIASEKVVYNRNDRTVLDAWNGDSIAFSHVMYDERYGLIPSTLIKSYSPVQISFGTSNNDHYDFFISKRVMLPPISWRTLCGDSIPSLTKQKISSYVPSRIDAPIGLLVTTLPPSSPANSDDACSIQEIMANVEKLNQEVDATLWNPISFLVVSNEHLRAGINNTVSPNQNSIANTTSGETITMALSVVFVPTSATADIEANIIASKELSGIDPCFFGKNHSKWPYYMTASIDVNRDGTITNEDYFLFQESVDYPGVAHSPTIGPVNSPTVNSDFSVKDSLTSSSSDQHKYMYGMVLLFVVGIFCVVSQIVLRRRLRMIQRRHQQEEERRTRDTANQSKTTDTVALTEDDFKTLPKIKYQLLMGKNRFCIGKDSSGMAATSSSSIQDERIQRHEQTELEVCFGTDTLKVFQGSDNSLNGDMKTTFDVDLEAYTSLHSKESVLANGNTVYDVEDDELDAYRGDHSIGNDSISASTKMGVSGIECCSICLEDFIEHEIVVILPKCSHVFHTECIKQWVLQSKPNANSCPLCKSCILDKILEAPSSTTALGINNINSEPATTTATRRPNSLTTTSPGEQNIDTDESNAVILTQS